MAAPSIGGSRQSGSGSAFATGLRKDGKHDNKQLYMHIIVYTGCPKNVTFRMLLEPQCTLSITSSQHISQPGLGEPVSGNHFCWSFPTKTKQDQALPSLCPWEKLAPQHSILVRTFELLKVTFFLGHPVKGSKI